jgi:aspartate kinase
VSIIVQKFGGTSVGSIERIQHVARKIEREKQKGKRLVVVVSAMGKSTDGLVAMAKQIAPHPSEREMDMLLTTGEQVSISLLTLALHQLGIPAVSMTGWQAGIQTESVHGRARILEIDTERIFQHLERDEVVVVAGFQGISAEQQITTLGRGGSDTTAVALAAAVQAERCDIYTDVQGVYTADPRLVPEARKLDAISYDEMLELAHLGASVLHPRAVECAKNNQVKLTVRSTFEDVEGTVIEEEVVMENGSVVHGVAHEDDVTKVTVRGVQKRIGALSSLFTLLAEALINVDIIINQSTHDQDLTNISFSIHTDDLQRTLRVLEENQAQLQYQDVLYERDLAKVSIVGAGMASHPGVAAEMFSRLSEQGIEIKMVSTSEIKVSCVIPQQAMVKAVRTLHHAFGLDQQRVQV